MIHTTLAKPFQQMDHGKVQCNYTIHSYQGQWNRSMAALQRSLFTYTHTLAHTRTHVCKGQTHAHTRTHKNARTQASTHAHNQASKQARRHARTHACTQTSTQAHTHTRTRTRTHTHKYQRRQGEKFSIDCDQKALPKCDGETFSCPGPYPTVACLDFRVGCRLGQ
jgi:hypothetical protein